MSTGEIFILWNEIKAEASLFDTLRCLRLPMHGNLMPEQIVQRVRLKEEPVGKKTLLRNGTPLEE